MLGPHCRMLAFSSCGYSLVATHRLLIVAASWCTAQALQWLWHTGLAALQHVGICPDQGWTRCPLHWQEDNHWTTREVLLFPFLNALLPLYNYEPEVKRGDGHVGENISHASVCM